MTAPVVGAGFKPAPAREIHHTHMDTRTQPQAQTRAGIHRHETTSGSAKNLATARIISSLCRVSQAPLYHQRFMRCDCEFSVINAIKQPLGQKIQASARILTSYLTIPPNAAILRPFYSIQSRILTARTARSPIPAGRKVIQLVQLAPIRTTHLFHPAEWRCPTCRDCQTYLPP